MASLILKQAHTDWVLLEGKYHKEFVSAIRLGIQPPEDRYYDQATNKWLVCCTRLPMVLAYAKKYYSDIDMSNLPEEWLGNKSTDLSQAYSVLFLVENSPLEVVTASYKALAQKYHPDHGGSQEKMTELNLAYDKISQALKSS